MIKQYNWVQRDNNVKWKVLNIQKTNRTKDFPKNPNLNNTLETREIEQLKVNLCRTQQYQNIAIPLTATICSMSAGTGGGRRGQEWGGREKGSGDAI